MTVKEYAEELKMSVKTLLEKCESLGINVKNEDDYLEDEDIIMLDNIVGDMADNDSDEGSEESNLLSEELESKFSFEDRAEELLGGSNISLERTKKVKLKKKDTRNMSEEYKKENGISTDIDF